VEFIPGSAGLGGKDKTPVLPDPGMMWALAALEEIVLDDIAGLDDATEKPGTPLTHRAGRG
jgi:hypothetical protein